ncbi:hypothetical protein [Bittarella massiliensis (ex Durand et al. 2017)]|uniref:hypothetical protein n=1 Tax=Bittarella massiliensis (ex Durand et al. 2017) TaxID=1720313 RepID=UPI00073EE298|nr:hypothetical protein [Bittarella massiliensis (ex Durand et al. 2017)]
MKKRFAHPLSRRAVALLAAGCLVLAMALTGCGKEATGYLDEGVKETKTPLVRVEEANFYLGRTILLEVREQGYDLSLSPDFTQPLSEEDRIDAGGALLPVYLGRDGQVVARLGCANTGNGVLPTLEARVKSFEIFFGPCPADVEAPENAKPRVAIGGVDFTGQDAEEVASLLEEKAGSVTSGEGPSPSQYTVGGCMYTFSFAAGGTVNRVWVQGL